MFLEAAFKEPKKIGISSNGIKIKMAIKQS
jgi:hypothetical protein